MKNGVEKAVKVTREIPVIEYRKKDGDSEVITVAICALEIFCKRVGYPFGKTDDEIRKAEKFTEEFIANALPKSVPAKVTILPTEEDDFSIFSPTFNYKASIEITNKIQCATCHKWAKYKEVIWDDDSGWTHDDDDLVTCSVECWRIYMDRRDVD